MDNGIREWLEDAWRKAQVESSRDPDPLIDAFTGSSVVSIRYALITQLLGKIADPARSLKALQLGQAEGGAWDARSFSTAVVVPWANRNQNVLGTSAEPYASKPLRRPWLASNMTDVRNKAEWNQLVDFFDSLENASRDELENVFRRVLGSLVRQQAEQTFNFPVPQRVSMEQVESLLAAFLDESSGGLRPLAVAAALFRIVSEGFSLFSEVRAQGVNEADAAAGMPGDIVCYSDDGVVLVVEVKDTGLTLAHVQSSSRKAKQTTKGLSRLLFAVPRIDAKDESEVAALIEREWAGGLDIHSVDIRTLARTVFMLLDEQWRTRFLGEIGNELDKRQDQLARRDWFELLSGR